MVIRRNDKHLFVIAIIGVIFFLVFIATRDHPDHYKYKITSMSQPVLVLPNVSQVYLRPANMLYPELSFGDISPMVKHAIEDIIRKGQHLKPYVTERGEAGWVENGIVYRPWRKADPSLMHPVHPSPYFTEYEAYVPFDELLFFEGQTPSPNYNDNKKIIVWHTPTRYTQRKHEPQALKACPEFPCTVTTNMEYAPKSSAMILTAQIIDKPPPNRSHDQVLILHNHEPPGVHQMWKTTKFNYRTYDTAFNWTMTYRPDSDFVVPYGIVRKRPTPLLNKDYESIVGKKKKIAAWLVSNCAASSQRDKYVKELSKYIDVDVYGKCGTKKCPHEKDDECADLIATQYKFYISFESSFCEDYITEKLFHYLTMDTIVVARGSDQYFQHIPSEIFINARNFPTPKKLAMEMLRLDQNDQEYMAMLKEKDKYMSLVEGFPVRNKDASIRFMAYRFESVSICQICQRLWNLDKYRKTIPNIKEWFNRRLCHPPTDLNF